MGHGDGRPGTPAPDHGGGGEAKATFSGGVVLVGIISFVLGVIAVAVPYWGLFRPQSGKWKHCIRPNWLELIVALYIHCDTIILHTPWSSWSFLYQILDSPIIQYITFSHYMLHPDGNSIDTTRYVHFLSTIMK